MVLAQHFFTGCLRLAKCTANPTPAIDWLDCLIGPGGSLFPTFSTPSFSFMDEVGKKKTTKLGCEKDCCKSQTEHGCSGSYTRWFVVCLDAPGQIHEKGWVWCVSDLQTSYQCSVQFLMLRNMAEWFGLKQMTSLSTCVFSLLLHTYIHTYIHSITHIHSNSLELTEPNQPKSYYDSLWLMLGTKWFTNALTEKNKNRKYWYLSKL
jgi:hypothetical protein